MPSIKYEGLKKKHEAQKKVRKVRSKTEQVQRMDGKETWRGQSCKVRVKPFIFVLPLLCCGTEWECKGVREDSTLYPFPASLLLAPIYHVLFQGKRRLKNNLCSFAGLCSHCSHSAIYFFLLPDTLFQPSKHDIDFKNWMDPSIGPDTINCSFSVSP